MAEAVLVDKALSLKDAKLYDQLKHQVEATDALTEEEMIMKGKLFEAMGREAPRLVQKDHGPLLEALFKARPHEAVVLKGLGSALASVVSAKSTFVGKALMSLLKVAAGGLADPETLIDAVLNVLVICPQGTTQFVDAARESYPWSGLSIEHHLLYIRIVLGIAQRQPLVEPAVFDLVISRAIEVDALVEKKKKSDTTTAVEQTKGNKINMDVFEMDLPDDGDTAKIDTKLPEEEEVEDDATTKIDRIMALAFSYVATRLGDDGFFAAALDIFEAAVLHTHDLKFVQFVFFQVATATTDRATKFAARLVDLIGDAAVPRITRLSAVAYLASFLCRSKSVDAALATQCADKLFAWAEDGGHLDDDSDDEDIAESFAKSLATSPNSLKDFHHHTDDDDIDRTRHRRRQYTVDDDGRCLFVVTLQALLYVMCFRGDEVFRSTLRESTTLRDATRWRRLLGARNAEGFRRCDPRIRAEFLKVCARVDLFTSDYLASLRAVSGTLFKKNDDDQDDDDDDKPVFFFFPFDPYLLPESRAFVTPHYRDWAGGAEDDPDDDDDDDDDVEEDDDDQDAARFVSGGHLSPSSFSPFEKHLSASISPAVSFHGRPRVESIGRADESW